MVATTLWTRAQLTTRSLGKAAAIHRLVDLRLKADRPKLGDQAFADRIVGGGVDRMRSLIAEDALQARDGALGVELVRSSLRGGKGGAISAPFNAKPAISSAKTIKPRSHSRRIIGRSP